MDNRLKRIQFLLLMLLSELLFSSASIADVSLQQPRTKLREIAVVGPIESADPYYRTIHLDDEKSQHKQNSKPLPDPNTVKPGIVTFPLTSKLLKPGAVTASDFKGSALFTIPVFVVGSDPLSLQWIVQRRVQLQSMHAIGYVVEVANMDAWNRIRQAAGDLPLYPIPGDGLSTEIGLKNYPALISNRGINP